MDGHQYEQKCAQYLREQGYTNVTVTRGSGDQGVDITAMKDGKKHAIQCKYYEGNVGNKAIQEVYAGAAFYNCSVAMVITNSFFTKSAKELAKKLKVILVEDINAIKLMESSRTAKPTENPKPVFVPPSEEERNEERYQYMLKCFSPNPKVDSEISQYVQQMQSRIADIVRQYHQEYSKVSGWADSRVNTTDAQQAVTKKFFRSLQKKINEIDRYGRDCIKKSMSEDSAKKLIGLIVGTVNDSKRYNASIPYIDQVRYNSHWDDLKRLLPSELEGPDAKSVRKEINLQKDLIRIQEEQIAELQRKIDTRDSVLAALKRESQQQNAEIDSYKKKMNSLPDTQNAKLVPLDQQLESISSQMQQESERRIRLEQEKKSKSLLAFKEKRALQEQIQECTTKLDSLKAQAQDCEQRKIAISSKYSKRKDELQGAINAAALKQQQAEEQIRQLQNDIRKHVTEKQLNARKLELEQMLKTVNELEDKANRLRNKYMKVHLRMDIHDFEKWLEGGKW